MKKKCLYAVCVFLAVIIIWLGVQQPEIEGSIRDVILQKASDMTMVAVLLAGFLIEADFLNIKKDIPLAKSSKAINHIFFWFIVLILAGVLSSLDQIGMSKEYKAALLESESRTQDIEVEEPEETITDETLTNIKESKDDDLATEETENESLETETPETEALEDTQVAESEPYLIEEETYYFDDARYTVMGVEISVESITLKRKSLPAGYIADMKYSVINGNDTEVKIDFNSVNDIFQIDGEKLKLSPQYHLSSSKTDHPMNYHLDAGEVENSLYIDFYAVSRIAEKDVNGNDFDAYDLSEIYSNQKITLVIEVIGTNESGDEESLTIQFDL